MQATELSDGWEVACAAPGTSPDVGDVDGLEWHPAQVPGTAAAALRAAGRWDWHDRRDFDADDWWFRTRFEADSAAGAEELILALDGIATVSDVYLNGEHVLSSDSMFAAHRLEVGRLIGPRNELAIHCRALGPLLDVSRRPRPRWRTALVAHGNLRFYRTMLLGRAPGFAPGPAAVGPWKPVRLERSRGVAVQRLELRPRLDGGRGRLAVRVLLRTLAGAGEIRAAAIEVSGEGAAHGARLELTPRDDGTIAASGELVIDEVRPWWPHTHGEPSLYRARLMVDAGEQHELDAGTVGFRALESRGELERDGVALAVNGVPVFARGAVWTPVDPALPCSRGIELERALRAVTAAGMNMLRVPGIGCYESEEFYESCDRLGILVWQDFMFANLDYPERDEQFMEGVRREVTQVLGALGRRPSLAVLCGGSEVAQQVAMLGLDPQLANGPLYGELLPSLVEHARVDAPYIPSTPWGGDLPFRPGAGVANYYGVGAYRRPLSDARLAGVRFAGECLAFANVPDDEALQVLAGAAAAPTHHPRWKAGVPRDVGAGWDFDDVRDHYLRELFGVDPVALRSTDAERYLELSRAVSGEVMGEVFGEWRRAGSPCGGGLVLWLTDLMPGAGWGVLDHRGEPKVAYHHLRRALAPVAVWSTDEGLDGVAVHVANDLPVPLRTTMRVALYRDLEIRVDEGRHDVELEPHSSATYNVETILGRFADVSWAYRFGPPAQDLIAVSLEREDGELLSQCFRLPAGRPLAREAPERLAVEVHAQPAGEDAASLTVSSERFLYGVRPSVPGFCPEDDAFSVEPGRPRVVALRRIAAGGEAARGSITALNLDGRVPVEAVVPA
ncbi:MAG: glycosyl hydrolase 2 galactose-binding domain-containing protein [Solirubrobacteraceae bacterium]